MYFQNFLSPRKETPGLPPQPLATAPPPPVSMTCLSWITQIEWNPAAPGFQSFGLASFTDHAVCNVVPATSTSSLLLVSHSPPHGGAFCRSLHQLTGVWVVLSFLLWRIGLGCGVMLMLYICLTSRELSRTLAMKRLCLRGPRGFPRSSVGKESAYNAGDPGSRRSTGEGLGYPL